MPRATGTSSAGRFERVKREAATRVPNATAVANVDGNGATKPIEFRSKKPL